MTELSSADLCPGCFADKAGANPCPHCGYDERAERAALLLPHRTLLHGQFLVGRVLGKPGGFGITYLGWDLGLLRRVAIKEYLPRDLAGRGTDHATVAPHSAEDAANFRFGIEQFQAEARTLARLDHPNIVRVHQVLAAHGTAYLVMEYYPGLTLAEHLDHQPGGRLPEATALALMQPLLDGLRAVHAEGLLHRDIKPQNIYLAAMRGGGARPILIDFGAARQAAGERSRSLSVLLTEGYAPLEQYSRRGRQGPWTDVYAAAAVLYRMLTGSAPPDAHDRTQGEPLRPAAAFGVSTPVSAALDRALAMAAGERPQSVAALQQALAGAAGKAVVGKGPGPSPPPPRPPRPDRETGHPPSPPPAGGPTPWPWVVGGVLALAGIVAEVYVISRGTAPVAPNPPARLAFEPEMVLISAGDFLMGSPDTEPERSSDEEQHPVQIEGPFAIGKYEVTVGEFRRFVAVTGYRTEAENGDGCWGWKGGGFWEQDKAFSWRAVGFDQTEDSPVGCVSWNDARDYAAWLSRETGKAYRLPTEAEWEYAARAGTTTPFWTGDCIHTDQANYDGNYDYNGCAKTGVDRGQTLPVGSLAANPWGLHDVAGNAWEWTCSAYANTYDGKERVCISNNDANAGLDRVIRGGSFDNSSGGLRSAFRLSEAPSYRIGDLGFRLAQDL